MKSIKIFYIISTCFLVLLLIVFEVIMYFVVGEDVLMQKGVMRSLWLYCPFIILILSFVRDIIIKNCFKDNK